MSSSSPPDAELSAPQSAFFRAWARFVLRHRLAILGLSIVFAAGFSYLAATRLTVDSSSEALLASKSDVSTNLFDYWNDFGPDKAFVVLVEGDVFSLPFLKRLRALHTQLEALDLPLESLGEAPTVRLNRMGLEGGDNGSQQGTPDAAFDSFGEDEGWGDEDAGSVFEEVLSLINVRETRGQDGALDVRGLLDDWPTEDQLPALKEHVLGERAFVGRVIGREGRHAMLLARSAFMSPLDAIALQKQVRELVAGHDGPGFRTQVTGQPVIEAEINLHTVSDVGRVFSLAMLVTLLLMALLFRHPIGVLAPVLTVIQADIWTFGVMALAGAPVTPVTSVLASFLLCVGIGDAIHIQSVYRQGLCDGMDNGEAIVHSLGSTGLPVLFTSLTTALGLLSFLAAELGAIQDMGVYGAIGVCFALFHSIVFVPIMLSFHRRGLLGARKRTQGGDAIDAFLLMCDRFSRARRLPDGGVDDRPRKRALGVAAVFAAACLFGIGLLRTYHNPIEWFPPETGLARTVMDVDRNVGGVNQILMMVSPAGGQSLKSRDTMLGFEQVEQRLMNFEQPGYGRIVGNVTSVVDVVRESHRALHGGGTDQYRVPDSDQGVVDAFTLFQNAGPDQLKQLMTVDQQRALINVRVRWLDATAYGPLTRHVTELVEEILPGSVVKLTGSAYMVFSIVSTLLRDLLRSFGTALVVITLLMVVMRRDLKLGLVAMVPNLLPIAAVLGFMGLVGVPMDLNNVMVASIAIGVAVDDTIHFMHQFRAHHAAHGRVDRAIEHAFSHSGRAMVGTSAALASGFVVFLGAQLLNAQRFGGLVAASVVFALLVDLLFAPALLRTLYRDR